MPVTLIWRYLVSRYCFPSLLSPSPRHSPRLPSCGLPLRSCALFLLPSPLRLLLPVLRLPGRLRNVDPGKARLLAALFAYMDGPTPSGLAPVRQAELVLLRSELVSKLAEVECELAAYNHAPGVPGVASGVPPVPSESPGVPDVPAEPTKNEGRPGRGQGGYSAIELVIVLALMSILIGLSVPVYSGITASAHQVVHQEQVAGLAKQSQINQILAGG
jgi:prepilin-type N-terminal cleavage/methylation domain-containing protein